MREIKFRAWDTDKNKMVKVDTIDFYNGNVNDVDFYNQEIHFGFSTILLQYTGLKDKNGTDIYEGDILQESTTHPLKVIVSYGHVKIEFYDLGEKITDLLFQEDIDEDGLEVIGNVFQNGGLLNDS